MSWGSAIDMGSFALGDFAVADGAVVLVVVVSAVFGGLRGLVKEILALVIWIGALVLAVAFRGAMADWLDVDLSASVRDAIGFAAVFAAALVMGALLQRLARRAVNGTGLTGADRMLGFLFGAVRGALVATIALILLRPFTQDRPWWGDAILVPPLMALEAHVLEARDLLFESLGGDLPGPVPLTVPPYPSPSGLGLG